MNNIWKGIAIAGIWAAIAGIAFIEKDSVGLITVVAIIAGAICTLALAEKA
jgi:hypothetical protein